MSAQPIQTRCCSLFSNASPSLEGLNSSSPIYINTPLISIDTADESSSSQSFLCPHLPQVYYFPCIKLCAICLAIARATILLRAHQKPVPLCGKVPQAPSTSSSRSHPKTSPACVTCLSEGTRKDLKHQAGSNSFSTGRVS